MKPAEELKVGLGNFLARYKAVRAEAAHRPALALKNFMLRYRAVQAIAGRAEERIERLTASRFSVFHYVWPDELALSRLIADLLDPRGRHGQGPLFLRLFLKALNRKMSQAPPPEIQGFETAALAETIVVTEAATSHLDNTQRRIDILLVNPHWGLAIENKPWAGEQERQLADYQAQLARKYPDRPRALLYLSGDGSPPATADSGYAAPVVMGYHGGQGLFLNAWLAEARDSCQVDKVRHFLADLTGWVENNFKPASGEGETRAA